MTDKPTAALDEARTFLKGAESYKQQDPDADFVEWRIARAYLAEHARAEDYRNRVVELEHECDQWRDDVAKEHARAEALAAERDRLAAHVAELKACRAGYASEFPPASKADRVNGVLPGDPDVGRIHEHIRNLKASVDTLTADRDQWVTAASAHRAEVDRLAARVAELEAAAVPVHASDTGPGPSEPITDTRALPAPQIGPPDARPIVDDLGAVAAVVRSATAVLEAAGGTDTFADHGTTPDTPDTETTP